MFSCQECGRKFYTAQSAENGMDEWDNIRLATIGEIKMSREVFAEVEKRAFPGATGGATLSQFPNVVKVLQYLADDNDLGKVKKNAQIPANWLSVVQESEPWIASVAKYRTTKQYLQSIGSQFLDPKFLAKKFPGTSLVDEGLAGVDDSPLLTMAMGEDATMQAVMEKAPSGLGDFINECFDGESDLQERFYTLDWKNR